MRGWTAPGKGTQTKLTAQRLKEQGRDLRQITFPDYDSESSALVKMYLSGAFGDKPDDVNAYAASSFYAVDRFASYKTDWGEFYREGGLVLSDRYTTSNAVHQCSKLPPMHWDGFLNWLFDFEYKKFGIPAPDAVIYLAVDPEVSQRLITEQYRGRREQEGYSGEGHRVSGPQPRRRRVLRPHAGLAPHRMHHRRRKRRKIHALRGGY